MRFQLPNYGDSKSRAEHCADTKSGLTDACAAPDDSEAAAHPRPAQWSVPDDSHANSIGSIQDIRAANMRRAWRRRSKWPGHCH